LSADSPKAGIDRAAMDALRSGARSARDALVRTAAMVGDDDAQRERLTATAERLAASVLRPLDDLLGAGSEAADSSRPEPTTLGELATRATALRATPDAPPELLEATAALQDLACDVADEDGSGAAEAKLAELRELQADLPSEIQPAPNGPYLVTGAEILRDWLGRPLPTRPQMALCRCGASEMKPFCDGSHARVGFSDEKSRDRVPDRRDTYVGQQVTIFDNRGTCQHSGFCTDRLASVFRLGEEPFARPSGGRMDEIIRAVRDCPSGALSYGIDGVEAREEVDYHGLREPAIEVSKDGPYRITGGLPLGDAEGKAVGRNEGASREHYALCRCGQSQNKPFCSGMHWYVDFHDPTPDRDRTPTMFEWCGGLPALTRMTRLFYERHVPQDPLLAPLFADMSADHPQRVAKWLGEVFGGPGRYSEEHGGYPRMLSQHVGKGLSEEQRARWVSLLLRSSHEAGLPNDPEFRAAFGSYIEWGSRLAVENSQSDAQPPEHMPMPRWGWNTGAGPPGSRISALAPPAEEPAEPVVLPARDEPVRFEKHIKPLFRSRDRESMRFAFDLWSYDDVRANAPAILERIRAGSMPCDGAWPPEWVETFDRWAHTATGA
jgi:CDGSH-type Zn-finger protein/truncated hemoglobin YjbI/ferredoxin